MVDICHHCGAPKQKQAVCRVCFTSVSNISKQIQTLNQRRREDGHDDGVVRDQEDEEAGDGIGCGDGMREGRGKKRKLNNGRMKAMNAERPNAVRTALLLMTTPSFTPSINVQNKTIAGSDIVFVTGSLTRHLLWG